MLSRFEARAVGFLVRRWMGGWYVQVEGLRCGLNALLPLGSRFAGAAEQGGVLSVLDLHLGTGRSLRGVSAS